MRLLVSCLERGAYCNSGMARVGGMAERKKFCLLTAPDGYFSYPELIRLHRISKRGPSMNSISREWNGLVNRLLSAPGNQETIELQSGLMAGTFFALAVLFGTGNVWLAMNVWAGAFLTFANILRFDDRRIGLASGLLAAICASGFIGAVFSPEIGWLTSLGVFVAVAPAIHMMDTEPGWGRSGRNALAVVWATVAITLFLVWFLENHTLYYPWA